jgi:hypothetical protein
MKTATERAKGKAIVVETKASYSDVHHAGSAVRGKPRAGPSPAVGSDKLYRYLLVKEKN